MLVLNLVASFQAFGTLLAIGPLLLPAAAARCWAQRVCSSIALNVAFGIIADYAGLLVSYYGNLPSGPAIVLAGGTIYGLSLIGADRSGPSSFEEQASRKHQPASAPSECGGPRDRIVCRQSSCRRQNSGRRDFQRHRRHGETLPTIRWTYDHCWCRRRYRALSAHARRRKVASGAKSCSERH